MNLQDIKNKDWSKIRQLLEEEVVTLSHWSGARVRRVNPTTVAVEGGTVLVIFDCKEKQTKVISKRSRYSSGSVSLTDLMSLDIVIKKWFEENFGGKENEF